MKSLLDDIQMTIDVFYQYREKLSDELRSFPLTKICSDDYNVLACRIKYLDRLIKRMEYNSNLLELGEKLSLKKEVGE